MRKNFKITMNENWQQQQQVSNPLQQYTHYELIMSLGQNQIDKCKLCFMLLFIPILFFIEQI